MPLAFSSAKKMCRDLVYQKDRSSFLIAQYMPKVAQDAYTGLRAFNIELSKAVDGATEPRLAQIKLKYFKDAVQMVHSPSSPDGEPATVMLHGAGQQGGLIAKKYMLTMVETKASQLNWRPFHKIEDLERYGEGLYSQMHYALVDLLNDSATQEYLASNPNLDEKLSDVAAHIGQAAGIAALLKGLTFYARKHNFLTLPVHTLADHKVHSQTVLDAIDKNLGFDSVPGLSDVVFDTATRANDHILTAESLFKQFKEEAGGAVPNSLLLTSMHALPIQLYLQRLEKADFNLNKANGAEWKLPWRTWRAWKNRSL